MEALRRTQPQGTNKGNKGQVKPRQHPLVLCGWCALSLTLPFSKDLFLRRVCCFGNELLFFSLLIDLRFESFVLKKKERELWPLASTYLLSTRVSKGYPETLYS